MAFEEPLTATEIYEQVTSGEGPRKLAAAAEAATQLRRALADLAADVRAAADETDREWEGDAGSRAAVLAMPLALASETDGALLQGLDRTISDQITAFARVHDSVVPVPPQPPAPTKDDVIGSLLGDDSYRERLQAYDRDATNNVAAFRSYHQASTANSDATPHRYSPLLSAEALTIRRTDPSATASDNAVGPLPPAPPASEIESAAELSHTRHSEHSDSPRTSTPTPAGFPDRLTESVGTPTESGPAPARSGVTPAAAHTSPSPVPAPPLSTGEAFGSGRHGSILAPGQHPDAVATTDPHGRVGNPAPRPIPSPGRGSGGVGAGGPDDSGRSRSGTTSTPGTAPGVSARSAAGMPTGATGRPSGGADQERRRPAYLRDPDPDDTYKDPLPKTAPPVVGDNPSR